MKRRTLSSIGLCLLLALPQVAGGAPEDGTAAPDMIEMETKLGQVVFPHLMHVDDFGMECTECHHEVDAVELQMPHEEYFRDFWIDCAICHVPGGGKKEVARCSECHHRSDGNIADETLSAKVVIHKACWTCHETGVGAQASEACAACHEPLAPEIGR